LQKLRQPVRAKAQRCCLLLISLQAESLPQGRRPPFDVAVPRPRAFQADYREIRFTCRPPWCRRRSCRAPAKSRVRGFGTPLLGHFWKLAGPAGGGVARGVGVVILVIEALFDSVCPPAPERRLEVARAPPVLMGGGVRRRWSNG
jgi:hypothetical protein